MWYPQLLNETCTLSSVIRLQKWEKKLTWKTLKFIAALNGFLVIIIIYFSSIVMCSLYMLWKISLWGRASTQFYFRKILVKATVWLSWIEAEIWRDLKCHHLNWMIYVPARWELARSMCRQSILRHLVSHELLSIIFRCFSHCGKPEGPGPLKSQ